ncbi:MAG: hypothetical protein Q4B26_16585 [Eubacteriales bacterium]|nr:hypothetical protein [Eubacteriales bacterium]
MNQVDKELLVSKGFMNEQERIDDRSVQSMALMEATSFAGAMLDVRSGMANLMAVTAYIEDLAVKKQYMHLHLYVQRCYSNCRSHGELDGFYVASLYEDILEEYAIYFTLYLRKVATDLNEAMKTVRANQGFFDWMTQEHPAGVLGAAGRS